MKLWLEHVSTVDRAGLAPPKGATRPVDHASVQISTGTSPDLRLYLGFRNNFLDAVGCRAGKLLYARGRVMLTRHRRSVAWFPNAKHLADVAGLGALDVRSETGDILALNPASEQA